MRKAIVLFISTEFEIAHALDPKLRYLCMPYNVLLFLHDHYAPTTGLIRLGFFYNMLYTFDINQYILSLIRYEYVSELI